MKMQNPNDFIRNVEKLIGYDFDNVDLLLQAFTRSSYSAQFGGENNEVLEFIGDEVLDFYVAKIIAEEFGFMKSQSAYYDPDHDNDEFCIIAHHNEADFTQVKQELVSNKNLARIIDEYGFAEFMRLGDGDLDNNVIHQEKVKADLFEAILGAVAIDSDWDRNILQNTVRHLLRLDDVLKEIDTTEERPEQFKEENAVNTLKELGEHGVCSVPEYYLPDEQVEQDGKLWWACTCYVRSWNIQKTALSISKKRAKKYAAYLVLCKKYGIPNEFEDKSDDE